MRPLDPSGRGRSNHELGPDPCGTRDAPLTTVGAFRRLSSSDLQLDFGDRVGAYQVIRRVAPNCYDAEAVTSGTSVRIDIASEEDGALIDVRFSRARTRLELVDHGCVAQIVDQGVLASGRPWVASTRPPGTPLSAVLARRKLEPAEVAAFISSVAGVLAYAHHRQVVHGSLRPHHLTLSRGARVSISGWVWLRTPEIPAFGDPTSTSVFNAPEHDGQSPIDGRADVYALGAIAYRALTGVFPDVSRDLLDERSPLGAVLEKMLTPDPRNRANATSVVAVLHEQRHHDRASARELEQRSTERMWSPSLESLDPPTWIELSSPVVLTDADLAADHEATEESPVLDPGTDAGSPDDLDDLERRCTARMMAPSI